MSYVKCKMKSVKTAQVDEENQWINPQSICT